MNQKDQQIQIIKSKEIVDTLRSEILDTYKILDNLICNVKLVRNIGFDWYDEKSLKDIKNLISNVFDKVEKWRDELIEIQEEIGGIIK